MGDAIERMRLDRCIVNHILEENIFTHLQLVVETPRAQEIAAQATVATQTIDVTTSFGIVNHTMSGCCIVSGRQRQRLSTTHSRLIGHLKAVGHMTGERDVENGRTDAMILDHIDHLAQQWSGLPSKGTARFEDDLHQD